MLNQIVLVGRLVQGPEIKELENGEKKKELQVIAEKITFLSSKKEDNK